MGFSEKKSQKGFQETLQWSHNEVEAYRPPVIISKVFEKSRFKNFYIFFRKDYKRCHVRRLKTEISFLSICIFFQRLKTSRKNFLYIDHFNLFCRFLINNQ